jgi:hypothetical protein
MMSLKLEGSSHDLISVYSSICLEGLRKQSEKLRQNIQFLGQGINQAL